MTGETPEAKVTDSFIALLESERIPVTPATLQSLSSVHLPLSSWIATQHRDTPVIIGINGSQGSGKSTMAKIQAILVSQIHDKRVLTLSIDDFYLGHDDRLRLSREIHPLLATRGVPGTHDTQLGIDLFRLFKSGKQAVTSLPMFDKSTDDRSPTEIWPSATLPVDIILFEGWCVGATPETDKAMTLPVNVLERDEDPDGYWRQYVNRQLAGAYLEWFGMLDGLVLLAIPNFNKVLEWRRLQESKLEKPLMSDNEVARFIMHYERITRHCLADLPGRADVVIDIDNEHQPGNIRLGVK